MRGRETEDSEDDGGFLGITRQGIEKIRGKPEGKGKRKYTHLFGERNDIIITKKMRWEAITGVDEQRKVDTGK